MIVDERISDGFVGDWKLIVLYCFVSLQLSDPG